MNAFDDQCKEMRTFVDISSPLDIDVIQKSDSFFEFKGNNRRLVSPVVVHFPGAHADWFHYKREVTKLKAHTQLPFINKGLLTRAINLFYNPSYVIFTFVYRFSKFLIRKEKMKLFPLMPTLRYK